MADAISCSLGEEMTFEVFSSADNSISSPPLVTHGCSFERVRGLRLELVYDGTYPQF